MNTMDKTLEMPQWLLDDNAKRSQGYARDVGDEVFLRSLNDHLKNETPEFSDEIKHPIIFFFGVPRCGKTFFSQLFNHYFDVGYPDNLIARFWRAPYFGIRLSQLLKSKFDAGSDFQSDFGKTKNLFDPHDFAYFWHEHLLKDSHPYDFEAKRDYIHWEKLKKSMAVFSQTFDKPCLFKGVNPSYHMHLIAEHIPQAVFIYLERDLIDAGVSLARARMKNYDDLNHWYGQNPSPKVYHEIKNLSWADQIAHQFQWLTEHYEKELSQMDERRYFRVNYKDFCSDPMLFFTALQARLQEDFGLAMKVSGEVSIEMLVYSSHTEQTTYYTELAQAFERIQLPHRLT